MAGTDPLYRHSSSTAERHVNAGDRYTVRNSLDGTVTVEFTGEGSELISVRMSGVDGSLDGDHAVLRAKEVMVQITAFGDATKYVTSPHISTGLDAAAASGPVVDPLQGVTPGSQMRAD
jgi:hypothetical protein